MSGLTNAERAALNRAMRIILAHTPEGASWLIDPRHTPGCPKSVGVSYFTGRFHTQHTLLAGDTFADMIQSGMDREAEEYSDPETARRIKIAALRSQLAELTATPNTPDMEKVKP